LINNAIYVDFVAQNCLEKPDFPFTLVSPHKGHFDSVNHLSPTSRRDYLKETN
jgi:hypothetical protein